MGVRVVGDKQILSNFAAAPRRAEREIQATFNRIGADLEGKSQRIAPLEESDLRDHAYSRPAGDVGTEVGYEGLPYIIPQHEGGWVNHMGRNGPVDIENYTTPGTGAKFLERPWLENKERYIKAVKDAARRARSG